MIAACQRLRLAAWDRLKYSHLAEDAATLAFLLRARLARDAATAAACLARVHGLAHAPRLRALVAARLRPWLDPDSAKLWETVAARRHPQAAASRRLLRSRILRAPGEGRRGVLFVAFERNLLPLLQLPRRERLFAEYEIFCAPSWSPPDYAPLWAAALALAPRPLYVGISHPRDLAEIPELPTGLVPVPIQAGDWIDPDCYFPRPHAQRRIDILMLANWRAGKRHWLLFRALRQMPPGLRVVLLGQDGGGRTLADVRREARWFGVEKRLEFVDNLEPAAVSALQDDSRINLIFSWREGSCAAVTEALFADCPVGMFAGARIGTSAYINAATGRLLRDDASLPGQLAAFLERSASFTPRAWALEHIACDRSLARLAAALDPGAAGGLAPLCWRPYPVYRQGWNSQALAGEYARLQREYGLEFEPIA